jgi:ABC-2 type transport system ATP-binding protein
MRTKANRLEELFVRMVEENAAEAESAKEGTT